MTTMTDPHEVAARERKASAIWAAFTTTIPDEYDPTDEQCSIAAAIAGVHPPSTATCDRVRELAALSKRLASRTAADLLEGM